MQNKLTSNQAAAIMLVRQEARHLNITLPVDAASTPQPLSITAPDPDEITDAVTKALEAGKDPGQDKTVQALVTRAYVANLHSVDEALEAKRDQAALEAFRDAVPAILDQLAEMFATDAATLKKHIDTIGPVPLDSLAPANMPLNVGKAALEVLEASKRIAKVISVWGIIHYMLNNGSRNPYAKTVQAATPTLRQWTENQLHGADPAAWDLVVMGVSLDLAADPEEVESRFASLQRQTDSEHAAALEAEKWGHGGQAARIAGNKGALDNLAHNFAQANAS
ncbi:hypothetical protein [Arthrobacter flavus]|uniref:Toxic anion resistance protein (TelA) n=1 Tax=Arthrobacter flavus TaxID=95172 RepID=A0ABW4Q1W1_9MICC